MFRRSASLLCFVSLLASFHAGCSRPQPEPTGAPIEPTATGPAGETAATSQPTSAPSAPATPLGWQRIEAPSATQQAMLQLGEVARVQLAQGLMGALTAATAGGDFAAGIDACHTQAPAIAEQLQTDSGGISVRVGRTSERLRNPANVAPEWVAAAMATPEPAGTWSDGTRVGTLTPIPTGALCVNCHGATDQLAPGVTDALARLYPNDQATGFAEGDLRGWFWVEVAATP